MKDPYKLLGVPIGASWEQLVASYDSERARLLAEHATDEEFEELAAAFSILSEPMQPIGGKSAPCLNREPGNLRRDVSSLMVGKHQTGVPNYRDCPNCGTPNPINANICSECGLQFSRSCPNCGARVEVGQPVCSRCQTLLAEYEHRISVEAAHRVQIAEQERRALDAHALVVAEEYRRHVWKSAVFWIVVAVMIGLCVLIWVTQFAVRG